MVLGAVLALMFGLCSSPERASATTGRSAVPAFPQAEGGGSLSRGGRGGRVLQVTNLNDSGPGSLRDCVERSGPRICVFRTGGTIVPRSRLLIASPYITIAGETAPGGGMQIDGTKSKGDVFCVHTHDVIITGIKIRPGYGPETRRNGVSAVEGDAVYNVVVDHDTIQWAGNKAISFWGLRGSPHDLTFSYNIIAETLAAHSVNVITGSDNGDAAGDTFVAGKYADAMTNIDFHHNYILNASHRNPLLKNKSSRFVNNIVFNWRWYATELGGGIQADLIGNVYRRGPLWQEGLSQVHEILGFPANAGNRTTATGNLSLYLAHNIGPHNGDPSADGFATMTRLTDTSTGAGGENGDETGTDLSAFRRAVPLPVGPAGARAISVVKPSDSDLSSRTGALGSVIFASVGATRRLECAGGFTRRLDTQERRLVDSYPDGGVRSLVPHESAAGGYPRLAPGSPCPDSDADGLPDAYEDARGLRKNDPADANVVQPDGYTNLEHYLQGR